MKTGYNVAAKFRVFKAGKEYTLEEANKHNKMYMANLTAALTSIPKFAVGITAANMLDTAIRSTKQDSSRFAANWNLALGGATPHTMPDPFEYKQSGDSYGSIGKRNAAGSYRLRVLMAKRAYYGYKKGEGGGMTLVRGRIAEALYPRGNYGPKGKGAPSGDKSGSLSRILLYNPFMKPLQRKSGWVPLHYSASRHRTGASYVRNAMGLGTGVEGALPRAVFSAGWSNKETLAKRMSWLSRQVMADTRMGKILDPFAIVAGPTP